MTYTVRNSREGDDIALNGIRCGGTYRAITIERDDNGAVVGMGGIVYGPESIIAFSSLDRNDRPDKRTVVKAARQVIKIIADCNAPVYATIDEHEPTAEKFLRTIGFVDYNDQGVLIWQRQ